MEVGQKAKVCKGKIGKDKTPVGGVKNQNEIVRADREREKSVCNENGQTESLGLANNVSQTDSVLLAQRKKMKFLPNAITLFFCLATMLAKVPWERSLSLRLARKEWRIEATAES